MSAVTGISGIQLSAASAAYAPTNSADVSAIASAYVESGVSSKQDTLTFGYDDDKISAINGSALAGEAQVVSAVGTETAYTPDGVSDVVTSINGNYISALSADSAFQASYDEEGRELTSLASEYVVSSIASSYAESAVSSKADSSALSSYALSADVSGTVDLVSTQSANWGGSALALSAGPGVKLEKVGDTLVASVDGPLHRQETLAGYWNGSAVYQQFISGTAASNGNTNFTIPDEITGTNIVNKWVDPSNSFIYYNTTSNALPISWCLGSGRYGSVGFVGSVINYRCVDTSPTTMTAYIALKYMKA